MQQKIIAVAVMLGLQLAAGAVQAEGHKKGNAVAEHASASKANPRYVINGGEVYDKKTDLTWQRCSVGQHWKGDVGCVGIIKVFTLDKAKQQGSNQWRLPSVDELTSLIDSKKADTKNWPVIDEDAFPDMEKRYKYYWSLNHTMSTCSTDGSFVIFDEGDVIRCGNPEVTAAVRLVRDGQ